MRPTLLIPLALLAGCTCGETHAIPDASFDAPGLDANDDAFTPPPFEPTLVWRAEGAGMCPELMTPVWDPPNGPAIARGQRRWGMDGTWGASTGVAPTFIANGDSYWGQSLAREQSVNYLTGVFGETRFNVGSPIVPETRDTEFRYALPRMTLGRDTIVIRDLFSLRHIEVGRSLLRAWTFPVLDNLFARERAQPLPWPPSSLEQSMPAWNPVTGQIAFTVGTDNANLAVQCAGDDMGQYILYIGPRAPLVPGRNPYTQLYYRENGELVVLRGERVYIVSPTGEVLRSASSEPEARAQAYHPGCGLLFAANEHESWHWWDVDAMAPGRSFVTDGGQRGAALGTEECGLMYSRRDAGWVIAHPDGTETIVAAGGFSVRGGLAMMTSQRRVQLVDYQGNVGETITAPHSLDYGTLTPDGNVITGMARWYLGYPPGPQLYLNSGLNWAHTNSPLPE